MDADTVIENPKLKYRLPLYPVQFLCAMAIVSLGPLLDSMMTELEVPLARGGLISAGLFAGNVSGIAALNVALAGARIKTVLLGGMVLQAAGLVSAGLLSFNLVSLFAAYYVVGLSGGLLNASCWMWQAAHMKKNPASAALQMISFFALAMMAVPLLAGLALDQGASWRAVLATEGGFSLLTAVVSAGLPLLNVPNRQNVRLSHLRTLFSHNRRLILGMMGAGFTYVGAEMTINVWLPKFHIEVYGASDSRASLSVTLFWVGLIAGRLLVMRLAKRFTAARLLLWCGCTFALFSVATALVPGETASQALAVGAGLGASASYGLIGSYSGRFPGWQGGVASSLFILCGGVGSITFPYLMGPLAQGAGFRTALAAVAVPAIIYAALSLLIYAAAEKAPRS